MVTVWRTHPEMTDYTALRASEAAFQLYRAEVRGHAPKPCGLTGLDEATFQAVRAVCELLRGRGTGPLSFKAATPVSPGLPADCLREPVKSTERHTAVDGRQGHLTFIDAHLPAVGTTDKANN